eukprot:2833321-Pleurochrysis_carterae.AAC.5
MESLKLSLPQGGLEGPLYTDNAKPQKDLSIFRAGRSLRQQGARRRERDLIDADCLERRSRNQPRDGERGDVNMSSEVRTGSD